MEYAINQPVVFELDDYIDVRKRTGKVAGHSGDNFIVLLDISLRDGTSAVLVPSNNVRPLACYWCEDTQRVPTTPITLGQIEAGDNPSVDCPYCKR